MAVLFAPVRDQLQRSVNRLMYGERDDPYAVVSRLGRQLESTLVPDAVLPTIVHTAKDALKLPYVAVEVAGRIAASSGAPMDHTVALPLVYQSTSVASLLLAPRGGTNSFSEADRRLLEDLARQAGIAVHAARVTADLQRSREHLVAAREEERRRLRRDLHDGLGSRLAGLNLQMGALRALIRRDPSAADQAAGELRGEIRAAIADIRRLVYDLRPPALDELGLVAAIQQRATRCSAGPSEQAEMDAANGAQVQVTVEAEVDLPPLPAAVEVATYRVVEEALTNVVRHARARTCRVRLSATDSLCVEVTESAFSQCVSVPRSWAGPVRSNQCLGAVPASRPASRCQRGESMDRLRILVADDHPLVRKGLRAVLAPCADLEVIAEASTGGEAAERAAELQPDVVLMDLQMPGGSGIAATREILAVSPHIRVLVVTLFEDDDSVFTALRAGARGYVLKDADEDELVQAIRAVGRGEAIFSPAVATRILAYFASPHPAAPPRAFPELTDREREVLTLVAKGASNPMIARQLSLSPKTVGNYVSNIFSKLQVADRAEAIVRAREAGLGMA